MFTLYRAQLPHKHFTSLATIINSLLWKKWKRGEIKQKWPSKEHLARVVHFYACVRVSTNSIKQAKILSSIALHNRNLWTWSKWWTPTSYGKTLKKYHLDKFKREICSPLDNIFLLLMFTREGLINNLWLINMTLSYDVIKLWNCWNAPLTV